MATNREVLVHTLATHRHGRAWTDEAVADDVLQQLGVDPAGEAKHARSMPQNGLSEDEVVQQETIARQHSEKAQDMRRQFQGQRGTVMAQAMLDQEARAAGTDSPEHKTETSPKVPTGHDSRPQTRPEGMDAKPGDKPDDAKASAKPEAKADDKSDQRRK
jgi:hypothetical protein